MGWGCNILHLILSLSHLALLDQRLPKFQERMKEGRRRGLSGVAGTLGYLGKINKLPFLERGVGR